MSDITIHNYVPKFLQIYKNRQPQSRVTHQDWNNIFNLLIEQGDYNAEVLINVCDEVINANATADAAEITANAAEITADAAEITANAADGKADIAITDSDEALGKANEVYALKESLEESIENIQLIYDYFDVTAGITVRYEVFTIVNADNGNETFTYKDKEDATHIGDIIDGHQVFHLQDGDYILNEHLISAYVNDTLHRSQASGGLLEVDSYNVGIIAESDETEITIKYFHITSPLGSSVIIADTPPETTFYGKMWLDVS